MTAVNWDLIERINSDVNSAVRPENDLRHYGRNEYWAIPLDGYGDCEDYALGKQKRLLDAGFPLTVLRLAIVLTARNNRHVVLTVTTNRGDYVLDNLRARVVPWADAQFTWLMRQDQLNPSRWSLMKGDADPMGPTSSTC